MSERLDDEPLDAYSAIVTKVAAELTPRVAALRVGPAGAGRDRQRRRLHRGRLRADQRPRRRALARRYGGVRRRDDGAVPASSAPTRSRTSPSCGSTGRRRRPPCSARRRGFASVSSSSPSAIRSASRAPSPPASSARSAGRCRRAAATALAHHRRRHPDRRRPQPRQLRRRARGLRRPASSASTPRSPASDSGSPSRSTPPPGGSSARCSARAASRRAFLGLVELAGAAAPGAGRADGPQGGAPDRRGRSRQPGSRAGLFAGDVLLTVGGQPVSTAQSVQRLMFAEAIGKGPAASPCGAGVRSSTCIARPTELTAAAP